MKQKAKEKTMQFEAREERARFNQLTRISKDFF